MKDTSKKKLKGTGLEELTAPFKLIDLFGAPMPTFNIKGETKVMTVSGGVLTIFIFIVFLIYALLKLEMLVTAKNPTVTEY